MADIVRDTGSPWAPLRNGVFRALWLGVLASQTGEWMQTVGAQWLLVHEPNAPFLVALVQTADALPVLLIALPAGVLADIVDRRWLLLIAQIVLVTLAGALTVLTAAGAMHPPLLILFTFLLAAASAVATPAYQSTVPDLVPRTQVAAASALGSITVNLARVIGPASAGLLIAQLGVAAVFGLNTIAFLILALVLAFWHPPAMAAGAQPERFVPALWAGTRYIRHAPIVQRLLLRLVLFLVPASALWALLPVVANDHLGLGVNGYGLMLGSLGAGAIVGALSLSRLKAHLSSNTLMVAASIEVGAALALLVLVPSVPAALIIMVPTGVAWIAVIATTNATLQLFLPGWVRARGLSMYQVVAFGTQAISSLVWGVLASQVGLVPAFLIAAGVMLVGVATVPVWPLVETAGMNRDLALFWPVPHLVFEPEMDSGPVVVTVDYSVASENEQSFFEAMDRVRQSRLRTGATRWGLYRDAQTARHFVESFMVPSWEEHLRQHNDRLTGTDQELQTRADAFSETPPQISHLIAVQDRD